MQSTACVRHGKVVLISTVSPAVLITHCLLEILDNLLSACRNLSNTSSPSSDNFIAQLAHGQARSMTTPKCFHCYITPVSWCWVGLAQIGDVLNRSTVEGYSGGIKTGKWQENMKWFRNPWIMGGNRNDATCSQPLPVSTLILATLWWFAYHNTLPLSSLMSRRLHNLMCEDGIVSSKGIESSGCTKPSS